MKSTPIRSKRRGFTLMEILVSVGIFALITGVLIVRFGQANRKAKISKAQTDLEQLKTSIEILYEDTGQHPLHLSLSPCVQVSSTDVNTSSAGIITSDGSFPNWNGPYLTSLPLDPWGRQYRFNARYTCNTANGCSGMMGVQSRVVHSRGSDGTVGNSDDVASVLCR